MNEKDFNSDAFSGFDSATPSEQGENSQSSPREEYTLTPDGGHYESPIEENAEPKAADAFDIENPQAEERKRKISSSFFPSGSYGDEAASPSFKTGGSYYDPSFHKESAQKSYADSWQEEPKRPIKKENKEKKYSFSSIIAVALATAIACTGCFYLLAKSGKLAPIKSEGDSGETVTEKVIEINGSIEELAEAAASKAGESVVGVQTTFAVQNFFSGQSTSQGSGSGVIYKSDGYIITNYHVIADAIDARNASITVFLDNNEKSGYEASVINYNISCDLAVLKIDKTGLNAIDIGDSKDLKVGQYVVAIGSPGGLEFMGSTSFGIVSGLDRQIATTTGNMTLIQTDAAINPGNSGGALVNSKGELIGISSSKLVDTSYEGMGFAIPVNTVVEICDNLIAHEGEGDPYTGISISGNYTSKVLEYYGYPVGAVVANVDADSPAERAGIKRGDIITKFGDTEITEYTLYSTALANYFPDDSVEVTYYRAGQTKKTTITIGSAN